jgi:glycosyltransferase involved in cell wall biosynthesis
MNLIVHDFTGHAFQAEFARALAARGHRVTHVYCASLRTTPQGTLDKRPSDPDTFDALGLEVDDYDRERMTSRLRGDLAYGRALSDAVRHIRPDVVLSANTPLDAQDRLQRTCDQLGIPVVFWLQDLIGEATLRLLRGKLPVAGELVGRYYRRMEYRLLRSAQGVVAITDAFLPHLEAAGVDPGRVTTVENWAPLDTLPVREQDNAWSRAQGLAGKTVLLYSGTLGMKHNPALLLALARHFTGQDDVRIVVCTQGRGADWLREQAESEGLSNLIVLGFQPFDAMPDVLGSASVLVAILEPDAGVFSVPSKVLSYLCASRPVLLGVPLENLAAQIVRREQAGRVVAPDDAEGFVQAADALVRAPEHRAETGSNGRRYAERAFDLGTIVDRFEQILTRAAQG